MCHKMRSFWLSNQHHSKAMIKEQRAYLIIGLQSRPQSKKFQQIVSIRLSSKTMIKFLIPCRFKEYKSKQNLPFLYSHILWLSHHIDLQLLLRNQEQTKTCISISHNIKSKLTKVERINHSKLTINKYSVMANLHLY